MKQRTIAKKVEIIGVGLHKGVPVKMILEPLEQNTGIIFYRSDKGVSIPLSPNYVVDTKMATVIGKDDVVISTIEHLLSAIYAYGIDNLRIILDNDEIPILDGSSSGFCMLLDEVGIQEQDSTKKAIKVKAKIVRAIPLPPISLKKGPVPICPPNKQVKNFFDKLGTTVEIKNEKLSNNFWATSGMMAPFYELLSSMSNWLVKRGVQRDDAQKYITSLFVALSEDAVVNSKKDLKYLVKESQTPKGLNEQGVKELRKAGFYKSSEKTLNSILKRLNKV